MGRRLKKKRRPSTSAFFEDELEHEDLLLSQELSPSSESKRFRSGSFVSTLSLSPSSSQETLNPHSNKEMTESDPYQTEEALPVSSSHESTTPLKNTLNSIHSQTTEKKDSQEDSDHPEEETPRSRSSNTKPRLSQTLSPSLLSKSTIHAPSSSPPLSDTFPTLVPSPSPQSSYLGNASTSFSSVPKNLFLVPTLNTEVHLDPAEIALEKELITNLSSSTSMAPPPPSTLLPSTSSPTLLSSTNTPIFSNFSSWLLRLAVRSHLDIPTLIKLHLSCSCSRLQTEHLALLPPDLLSSSYIPWTLNEDSSLLSKTPTLHQTSLFHKSPQAMELRKSFLNYISQENLTQALNLSYDLNLEKKS